jgi:hypothetical protein
MALLNLTGAPNNGGKCGHPCPEKTVQTKKPKNQKMKQRSDQAKNQGQTGVEQGKRR